MKGACITRRCTEGTQDHSGECDEREVGSGQARCVRVPVDGRRHERLHIQCTLDVECTERGREGLHW